jgi:tRNA modification GTPase
MAAETDAQIRLAQARAGALPPWITGVRQALAPWMARAEAAVDYGEDDGISLNIKDLIVDLAPLLALFHVEQGRTRAAHHLRDGIRLALVGRPNAGKSTLFNALAGEDRAIVTEVPGTTRDVLEVRCEWRGLPLRLFDTAGLRATEDPVERLGVARVAGVLEAADLVVHLVPVGSSAQEVALEKALEPFQGKVVVVHSFGDLGPGDGPTISAMTGDLDALEVTLRDRLLGGYSPDACLGALATDRQIELLDELVQQVALLLGLEEGCPPELPASLLQGAWGLLAKLTGEDRADSALDEVFKGFCLGK